MDPKTLLALQTALRKHGACCLALLIALTLVACGRGGSFSFEGEYSKKGREVLSDLSTKPPAEVILPPK